MGRTRRANASGFTIIEVVLVLAIAGLIFLMVFIALPMLQRNQRNTQREDDLARFLTAATDFQSNNKGRLPFREGRWGETGNFIARYIDDTCDADEVGDWMPDDDACTGDQFRDPDGTIYRFNYWGDIYGDTGEARSLEIREDYSYADAMHEIYVFTTAVCGTLEGTVVKAGGANYLAMIMVLEGGGMTCVTNGARANVWESDIESVIRIPMIPE